MEFAKISKVLLQRLPGYLAYLQSLPGEDHNISATTIANALGLGDVQVRKDLAKISTEGRCRTGRSRDQLIADIQNYLCFSSANSTILVGSEALNQGLPDASLNVIACFDLQPESRRTPCGKPIYSMGRLESFCKHYDVRIGIIAVAPENAQTVCDGLVACGIRDIWNFAPTQLKVPDGVVVYAKHPA